MPQRAMSGNEHKELYWHVERLWELSKGLPVEHVLVESSADVLGAGFSLGSERRTLRMLVDHMRHVTSVDLDYPIILAAEGWTMNGRTRLQKALSLDHKEIAVVRFPVTPEPDQRAAKTPT